jgi:hypothetical protein
MTEEPGCDAEFVARCSDRLLATAGQELPVRVRCRVDQEDGVRSVDHSFRHRRRDGQFLFQGYDNVCPLLSAMTFHEASSAVEDRDRERRSVGGLNGKPAGPFAPAVGCSRQTDGRLLAQVPEIAARHIEAAS